MTPFLFQQLPGCRHQHMLGLDTCWGGMDTTQKHDMSPLPGAVQALRMGTPFT